MEPTLALIINPETGLLNDKFSSTVRKEATKMLSVLLACTQDANQMNTLLNAFIQPLGAQIDAKISSADFKSVKWLMKELQRCLKHF